MARILLAALAMAIATGVSAAPAAAPQGDRTIQYCSDLVGTAAAQRNQLADQVVQLQAQLAMANRDLAAANARIAALTPAAKPAAK